MLSGSIAKCAQHRHRLDAETCDNVCDRAVDGVDSHFHAPACLARKKREPYIKIDWSSQMSSANQVIEFIGNRTSLSKPTSQLYRKKGDIV